MADGSVWHSWEWQFGYAFLACPANCGNVVVWPYTPALLRPLGDIGCHKCGEHRPMVEWLEAARVA